MKDNHTIFITGGTGLIGFELVKHFLKKEYIVIFTSRYRNKIREIYEKFKTNNLYGIPVNLEEDNSVSKIINFLEKNQLLPEILVNNARNLDYLKLTNGPMPSKNQWVGEYILDVVVPYELSMKLVYWKYSKLKSIINISSIYGIVAYNHNLYKNPDIETPINYSTAKAALIHLTKNLAVQLAKLNIRVNSISYGGVEGRASKELKERYARLCPIARMLKVKEVAGAVEFLATDMSSGMIGHNLIIDGGWTIW